MVWMRLDKLLANAGCGTRTEVKQLLKKGRVSVNGNVIKKPEQKVNPTEDFIYLDGTNISYERYRYYMLYKPAGCVTATKDPKAQTVMDFLQKEKREDLFPVGRLDKDTEGLLLITNDGDLAHQLLSPAKHIPKIYQVQVKGILTKEHTEIFEQGVDIGDAKPTLPAQLVILESGEFSVAKVQICEGRFHQIKRMFLKIGCEVCYLKRLSMGTLSLDETLKKGEYRPLTEGEVKGLKGDI